jgi:hypothetical protein
MHPYSSKAFPKYQECDMKCGDLGDLNLTKQNKLPCFIKIQRAWHEVLWFGRSQSDKTKQTTLLHKDTKSVAGSAMVWEILA